MKKIKNIYIFLVLLFLYLPILVLVFFSFNTSKLNIIFSGFTFKWYAELLHNDSLIEALYYTILIALIASIIATIVGTLTAIGINNMRGKRKSLLLSVNNLPIINPDIVTGVALMSLFIFLRALLAAIELKIVEGNEIPSIGQSR